MVERWEQPDLESLYESQWLSKRIDEVTSDPQDRPRLTGADTTRPWPGKQCDSSITLRSEEHLTLRCALKQYPLHTDHTDNNGATWTGP